MIAHISRLEWTVRQSSSNYRASDTFGVSELELNVMRWPMNVRKVGRTMEGPVEVKIRSITLFLWGVFDAVFQLHRDVIHVMRGDVCMFQYEKWWYTLAV